MEEPEYKIDIIKSDIPLIHITPATKNFIVEPQQASILSPVLLELLRSPLYKDWLIPDDNPDMVKCKLCGGNGYKMEEDILKNHMNSRRHITNAKLTRPRATCRTCLSQFPPHHVISLLTKDLKNRLTYSDILYSVTGIQVVSDDKPSTYLCQDCRSRALEAYNFQLRAQRADAFLRECTINETSDIHDNIVLKTDTPAIETNEFPSELVTKEENDEKENDLAMSDDSIADPDYTIQDDSNSDLEDSSNKFPVSKSNNNSSPQSAAPCSNNKVQSELRKCPKCDNKFTTVKLLIQHMRYCKISIDKESDVKSAAKTSISNPNQCRLCHKSFDNILALFHHVKTTHRNLISNKNSKSKTSESNTAKTTKRRRRKKFLKSGEGEEASEQSTQRCSVCSALFPTENELETHCREHGNTEVIMCTVCERVYFKYSQFKRHFNVHHPEMEAIVNADNTETILEVKDSEVKQQILQHMRMTSIGDLITANIPPSDEPVEIEAYVQVCGLCGCVILSPDALQLHNKNEHPDYDMRCTLCGLLSDKTEFLQRHIDKCRYVEKKFECPICGLKMAHESRILKHMSYKHNECAKRDFICDICGKGFVLESRLNAHKALCEPDCESQCETCFKVFRKKILLERHIKNFHTKDEVPKKHLCSYCGKSFVKKNIFDIHVRTHTGERPYKCNVEGCDQAFNTSFSLLYHTRKHTGKTPFKCTYCNKCFCQPTPFRRHVMTHTGERPYRCIQCNAGFIQRHCLVQHMKKHDVEPNLTLDPDPFRKGKRRSSNASKLVSDEFEDESAEERISPSIPRRKVNASKKRQRRLSDEEWFTSLNRID